MPSAPKKKTKQSGDEATVLEHYENLATIETKSMVHIEIGKQKFDTIKIDVALIQSPLREEATRELNAAVGDNPCGQVQKTHQLHGCSSGLYRDWVGDTRRF